MWADPTESHLDQRSDNVIPGSGSLAELGGLDVQRAVPLEPYGKQMPQWPRAAAQAQFDSQDRSSCV